MHYDSFDAPTAALQLLLSDFLIYFPLRCLKSCASYLEAIFLIQYSATERRNGPRNGGTAHGTAERSSKKQIKYVTSF